MAESNIVKEVCQELGITYKQLSEEIGYSEPAIKKAIANNNVSEPMKKAISLFLDIKDLKKQLKDYEVLKSAIQKAIE